MFPRMALVTGGASGIGAAIVDLLRAEGAEVQVLDLDNGFDVSDLQYRRILGANVDGVVFGTRRLARVMEPGSAIVATASLASLVAAPEDPLYTLTKHAVVGFVRSVARQLSARKIRINAVAPGFADTPLIGEAKAAFDAAKFPLLRPDDVARAVLFAARSDLTGQVWVVQPGREPIRFRFPNVPGPRDAAGQPVGAPPR